MNKYKRILPCEYLFPDPMVPLASCPVLLSELLASQSGGFTTDFFRELDLRQILVTEEEDTGAVEKAPVEVDAATSDFVAPRSQQEIDQALAAAEDVEDRNGDGLFSVCELFSPSGVVWKSPCFSVSVRPHM